MAEAKKNLGIKIGQMKNSKESPCQCRLLCLDAWLNTEQKGNNFQSLITYVNLQSNANFIFVC